MRQPRVLRLPSSEPEPLPLDCGEVLLSVCALSLDVREGDVLLVGERRLLVSQVSRTGIDYLGMSGPCGRLAMAVRQLASLEVGSE